jgi:hypothetical protein
MNTKGIGCGRPWLVPWSLTVGCVRHGFEER